MCLFCQYLISFLAFHDNMYWRVNFKCENLLARFAASFVSFRVHFRALLRATVARNGTFTKTEK